MLNWLLGARPKTKPNGAGKRQELLAVVAGYRAEMDAILVEAGFDPQTHDRRSDFRDNGIPRSADNGRDAYPRHS